MFTSEAVDFLDLFVLELKGEAGLDVAIDFVLTPEHGGLVDEVADGEAEWGHKYPATQGIQVSLES